MPLSQSQGKRFDSKAKRQRAGGTVARTNGIKQEKQNAKIECD
jgi:hypothetical protein